LKRIGTEAFLIAVVVSVGIFFAVFVLGMQVPGFAASVKEEKPSADKKDSESGINVTLVKDKPHTLEVPEEVRTVLGFHKDGRDIVAVAQVPTAMRPLILSGSTSLDPTHLARIRARFTPTRVVEIAQTHDLPGIGRGQSEIRELRPGDSVRKGDVLGIFYSMEVGSKKNDLLDALVQLELDQKILDLADDPEARGATPQVLYDSFKRAVYGDRNAIDRALNNLKAWDIPQEEIDALHVAAKELAKDKNAWLKTVNGRWVNGEKQPNDNYRENPWGRVTLKAPFDGVIVERNLHVDEMIIDNTVNLFQIADVSRLLVIANCPEDQLPALEALGIGTPWTVGTVGVDGGLPGTIEEIGYLIDPMQHTAVIKGYMSNPGQRLRGGQYVSATVRIPPPKGVVEIPLNALIDDGKQPLVFVQTDADKDHYTMRRVQVTHRFEDTAFVRSTPIPKEEQLTAREAEEGLLPKEALQPGDRVVMKGALELKLALLKEESKAQMELKQNKPNIDKK
jgi:cobalt-zinc-cadmium efflux system membrane fusion protein